jgi:hypothetical protein
MGGSGFVSSLLSSGLGLGTQAMLWWVFGGARISPIFSSPSPLDSPIFSYPNPRPSWRL